jgi:putative peptide maturation dehydrogenase
MRLRRCSILLLEPRETLEFDLGSLLEGGTGLRANLQWFALAPHLDREIPLAAAERETLGAIGETQWQERAALETAHGADSIAALVEQGLLISDDDAFAATRERDDKLRNQYWRPLSAVSHYFNRWEDIDSSRAAAQTGLHNTADLAERYGPPPHHFHARSDAASRIGLTRPDSNEFDALLAQRTTCRNWDRTRPLDAASFARVLHTVLAAQAAVELAKDCAAVKKTSPSGGGLHATEAYLVVQHVEGITPGLYHYHSGDHALEPLACAEHDLHALANRFVAGQHWFADAHVQVILTPRFRRSFWKYRNHAKAYRALILDAGHLSQTLYLTATQLGLGAFITSAINEIEIERAFALDALEESPLAVCGFGYRGGERVTVEFDPLNRVWP